MGVQLPHSKLLPRKATSSQEQELTLRLTLSGVVITERA